MQKNPKMTTLFHNTQGQIQNEIKDLNVKIKAIKLFKENTGSKH